jgi:hypothetical protein
MNEYLNLWQLRPHPAEQLARQHHPARVRRGGEDARAAVQDRQAWPAW